jgi:hypothetical protein
MRSEFTITTGEDELDQGLFGQVLLHAFVVLPYLSARGLRPAWAVRSKLYGAAPDYVVLPGVLDLAYEPAMQGGVSVPLWRLIQRFGSTLGDDWVELSRVWNEYFRIPLRIRHAADAQGSFANALGVHYRGNDKGQGNWDSNPVSHEDMAVIVQDALARRPDLERVFVATDDYAFVSHLERSVAIPVINLGAVTFHLATVGTEGGNDRADRAMLDCVLLSRCAQVLLNSSALSAFAKILNPGLEIYRCAASMWFTDVPYFPVAFIPTYASDSPAVRSVMARTMAKDWRDAPQASKFEGFAARPRFRAASMGWTLAEQVDRFLGRRPAGLRPDRLGRTLAGLRPR